MAVETSKPSVTKIPDLRHGSTGFVFTLPTSCLVYFYTMLPFLQFGKEMCSMSYGMLEVCDIYFDWVGGSQLRGCFEFQKRLWTSKQR